jgi:hypothetical protein
VGCLSSKLNRKEEEGNEGLKKGNGHGTLIG